MLVSDAVSQAYIKNWKPEIEKNNLIHYVHFVISNLPISNKRLKHFKLKWKSQSTHHFARCSKFWNEVHITSRICRYRKLKKENPSGIILAN